MNRVTHDLVLTLSRANLRGIGLPILALPLAWLYLMKGDRALTNYAYNTYRIPYVDGLFLNLWSSMQLILVQLYLIPCLALFALLYLCDRAVRSGSIGALAGAGAIGTAMHFVNLPFLAHWMTLDAYGSRTSYEMDKASGWLDGLDPLAAWFGGLMQVRLDPLAWPYPSDPYLVAAWWALAAFWALTLVVSATALGLGIANLAARHRPMSAPALA